MMAFFAMLLLLAAPLPVSLDQVKAEPNPERRARAAVDYAGVAEKNAETAYGNNDIPAVTAELHNVTESIETANEALIVSRKTPGRNPGLYKYAEQRSRELLVRLADLERKMDDSERSAIQGPKAKVQEIHDIWFEGIMGRRK